jgi:hypothetical protein
MIRSAFCVNCYQGDMSIYCSGQNLRPNTEDLIGEHRRPMFKVVQTRYFSFHKTAE